MSGSWPVSGSALACRGACSVGEEMLPRPSARQAGGGGGLHWKEHSARESQAMGRDLFVGFILVNPRIQFLKLDCAFQ